MWEGRARGEKGQKRVGREWKQKSRKGVQRHSRRRKMRQRNPREGKNKEVGGQSLNLIPGKIIKIVATKCHILGATENAGPGQCRTWKMTDQFAGLENARTGK